MSKLKVGDEPKQPTLSDVLPPTDSVAEVVDNKINIVINGESMDGLTKEGEDMPLTHGDKIDYSKYSNLTQLFVDSLVEFSRFISRGVPDVFAQSTPEQDEIYSTRNGIKAYRTCADLLNTQLKTGATGYVEPEEYQYLHQWYVNAIIDFMGITMSDLPDELLDTNDDQHVVRSAIEAFEIIRKKLLENIKGLMDVK